MPIYIKQLPLWKFRYIGTAKWNTIRKSIKVCPVYQRFAHSWLPLCVSVKGGWSQQQWLTMVLVHSCLFTLFSIILFSCFSPFFKVHITYVNVIEVNDLLATNNDDPIFRGSGQPFDRKHFSWTYCCKIIRLTVIIQTLMFVITTQLNHNQLFTIIQHTYRHLNYI